MKGYVAAVLTVGLGIAIWGATPASAQQVSSFEQLQLLVKPGDTIIVTDAAGQSTKGKIQSLTPASLRLSANKTLREYSQRDALLIRQWRGDSLSNGAAIGAVTGAGLGALSMIACGKDGGCDGAVVASFLGVMTALGAGVGVGVDALIVSRQTIYKSPGATARRFDIKPIVTGNKKGAAVTFSF